MGLPEGAALAIPRGTRAPREHQRWQPPEEERDVQAKSVSKRPLGGAEIHGRRRKLGRGGQRGAPVQSRVITLTKALGARRRGDSWSVEAAGGFVGGLLLLARAPENEFVT